MSIVKGPARRLILAASKERILGVDSGLEFRV